MEQEFTVSTGWKIFYGAIAVAMIIGSLFLFTADRSKSGDGILIIPVLLLGVAASILYNLYKRKVTVSGYGITYTTIFGTKELLKADVKGFRTDQKLISIEPAVDGYSKITIRDYVSIGDHKELIQWLQDNYKDLNKEEYEEQKTEILNDPTLGPTQLDREAKLKQFAIYTQIYTYVGMALLFLTVYLHPESQLLPVGLLIYPVIGILLFAYGKGIIKLFSKKNSPYPSIAMGIFFPTMGLVFQVILNTQLLELTNFWLPFLVVGVIVFFILYFIISKSTPVSLTGDIIFAILIAFTYAGGSILEINCGFDDSSPKVYKATVTDHHISHGKSTTYHLDLSEWGLNHQSGNVTVSASFYNKVAVNDVINVDLKKGKLNIPWYYLSQ